MNATPPPAAPPIPENFSRNLDEQTPVFKTARHTFDPLQAHIAVNKADLNSIIELAERKVDLNYVVYGQTPLTLSILKEQFDIANALVSAGCDVNLPEKSKWKRCPIHLACKAGDLSLVKNILKHGGSSTDEDNAGFSPLHWSCMYGHVDILEHLLKIEKVPVDCRDDRNRTPLHRATEANNRDVVKRLICCGADVNAVDNYGWTPIMQPIVCNYFEMVELLLSLGAEPNVQNLDGDSPLHLAAGRLTQKNILILLLTSVNYEMRHLKCASGAVQTAHDNVGLDAKIAHLLLDYGADTSLVNLVRQTPLKTAAVEGNVDVLKLLVNAGSILRDENWIFLGQWPDKIKECKVLCDWLQQLTCSVVSLSEICKLTIRKKIEGKISQHITTLPLPAKLINFLKIEI